MTAMRELPLRLVLAEGGVGSYIWPATWPTFTLTSSCSQPFDPKSTFTAGKAAIRSAIFTSAGNGYRRLTHTEYAPVTFLGRHTTTAVSAAFNWSPRQYLDRFHPTERKSL